MRPATLTAVEAVATTIIEAEATTEVEEATEAAAEMGATDTTEVAVVTAVEAEDTTTATAVGIRGTTIPQDIAVVAAAEGAVKVHGFRVGLAEFKVAGEEEGDTKIEAGRRRS